MPGGAGPYHANENTLYVTALNPGVTEPMLRSLFENYGRVTVSLLGVACRTRAYLMLGEMRGASQAAVPHKVLLSLSPSSQQLSTA
eukprot:scaffold78428_cov17-Tisochrysis_lutea.AAC.1